MDEFFRWVNGIMLAAMITTSGFYRARAHRLGGALPARPDGLPAVWVRVGFGLIVWAALLLPIVAPATVPWITVTLPDGVRLAGLALAMAAWAWLWWTLASIGVNISESTSTRAGASLVTHGPYRLVRHPLYSGGFLACIGFGVSMGSLPLLLATAILVWWLPRRVQGEEEHLVEAHGESYRRYQATTPKFIPRLFGNRG
ncbi:MAG: isoprenylcysteine carboxylmethyltransferase family protein [Gemmatimonadetes bacterium]|nr:isoprenylcysteine carboxylmethyltransferase family protein [Gemmatimonadota bacterium]